MSRNTRSIVVVLIVPGLCALLLSACSGGSEQDASAEPSKVEPIKGTDRSRVELSAKAAGRLGIETAPVRNKRIRGQRRKVMPYAALIYDAQGRTFAYTSPEELVFVRQPVSVDRINGDNVVLSHGPPAGAAVVTVGAQELYGVEYEVEED
jgi:multidrug efflux pump subunit AcrA (membrane-fusion protein)